VIQEIIIAAVFLAALAYLCRLVLKTFQVKSGCDSACGNCGVDFKKIEKKIAASVPNH
jgi:hypothetical protein